MKTFVLTVSRYFPKTHKRAGEPTRFIEKILNKDPENWTKIHTIRTNFNLWKNRIDQVNEGKAVLSLRYWTGNPYNSKQIEFCQLDKDNGIGIQKLDSINDWMFYGIDGGYNFYEPHEIACNDGLSYGDFVEWFKDYDMNKLMAIIHFTKFRY